MTTGLFKTCGMTILNLLIKPVPGSPLGSLRLLIMLFPIMGFLLFGTLGSYIRQVFDRLWC